VPTYEVETVRFADSPPVETEGCQSWYARAQNFLLGYSTLRQGAVLGPTRSDYEHVIGFVEGTIRIESESGSHEATADAIAIVPPGESRLEALTDAVLFRVFAPPPPDWRRSASTGPLTGHRVTTWPPSSSGRPQPMATDSACISTLICRRRHARSSAVATSW
jgi:quercetin dioxygenase-like cupin family protein